MVDNLTRSVAAITEIHSKFTLDPLAIVAESSVVCPNPVGLSLNASNPVISPQPHPGSQTGRV
jgi:hypothetical protein